MSAEMTAAVTGAAIVCGAFVLTRLLDMGVRLFRWWMSDAAAESPHFVGR